MRQTAIRLAAGNAQTEHEYTGEVTLQMIRGRARVDDAQVVAGDYDRQFGEVFGERQLVGRIGENPLGQGKKPDGHTDDEKHNGSRHGTSVQDGR